MVINYFKIAWRNIVKHSLYSFINVIGLFAGILFALLIGAYVWSEMQVNKNLRNFNQQYFLTSIWKDSNLGQEITTIGPLAKRLKEDYPNLVANYYRWDGITSVVSKGNKHFREGIQLGDPTLLSMYGFDLLHGNSRTAFINSYSVVITAEKALKYFNKIDVVGETIIIQSFSENKHDFLITGVLKDIPENSITQIRTEIKNTFFIPTNTFSYFGRSDFDSWNNTILPSYIELKEGTSLKDLEQAIKQLINQNASDLVKQNLTVKPVPLSNYYLEKENGLVKRMLYNLSFVGLFILLMAIVNFINISISSSGNRMKEIGVRKVLGGYRSQLIIQFLAESLILALIAAILAFTAYPSAKILFSELVGKRLPELWCFPAYFIFVPAILVILVGGLAGFYPAIILSSLKTVDSLKGKLRIINENVWLRKSLVGFQFSIALVVLIAASFVTQQVSYLFSQNLGYEKEYVISAQVPRDWSLAGVKKMETIRNEFTSLPQISNATLSFEIPNGNNGGQPPVYKLGTDTTQAIAMQAMVTDENYIGTYQIPLKAGSFFDNRGLDSAKVILNEKAVLALGYKNDDEAIGNQIRTHGDPVTYTIKGVTNDFHFGSMQQTIQPIIIFHVENAVIYRYLSFKIKSGNVASSIESIQSKWSKLMPGSSFEYTFMDDTLKKLYSTEIQLKKAAYLSTLLALIIVLLGVLGLVSLSIQKRIKEIGVRKVLGASVSDITMLFFKEFIDIIIVASIVASSIVYFIIDNWLNNYAYRIQITPQPFIWSIIGLTFITLLLIGFQAIKAAVANPVESLRRE